MEGLLLEIGGKRWGYVVLQPAAEGITSYPRSINVAVQPGKRGGKRGVSVRLAEGAGGNYHSEQRQSAKNIESALKE
jgi:hypothetical protein